MRTVKFRRVNEWFNKNFGYRIIIGEYQFFDLSNGQERMVTIEDHTTVQAKLMWCGAKRIQMLDDIDSIQEVIIKADRTKHLLTFFFAPLTVLSISVANFLATSDDLKYLFVASLIGIIVILLVSITLGRNQWLRIELVRKKE